MAKSTERDRQAESLGGIFLETSQDAIVARAGGGQTNATQLSAQTNRVATVATPGDSVMLPRSKYGMEVTVINGSANAMQVYGDATAADKINDVASATGVSQMAGSTVIYACALDGNWYTEGIASGFSGSYATQSTKDGIVAHAGGTQAGAIADVAAQLPAMLNRIATVGTAADSVVLPTATPGKTVVVANDAAANSANVFPFTGDSIDAGAANAARAVAAAKTCTFYCITLGKWHSLLGG